MFEKHHRPLYAYVYKRSGDSFLAEEIVQHAFIRYWQQKGPAPATNPEYFLFLIAKGLLIDHWRKKEILTQTDPGHLPEPAAMANSIDQQYEALHFDNLVKEASASLPHRQKQIFELNYYQEMAGEEIAESLNISPKTVSNLLTKAKRHVREKVKTQFTSLFFMLL